MSRRPLLLILISCALFGLVSGQTVDLQSYRTVDGSFNNLDNPRWGAAGDNLIRFTDNGYADGVSAPGGVNRPNPREISNAIFSQGGLINDPMGLSDFCWVFGQFIDHDLGLTPDGTEPMMIGVPKGDRWFDPQSAGQAIIPMMRSRFDPATGTGPDNPRRHPNLISAFIDASAVYGSSREVADWLRSFEGGKLRTSAGNMPPLNTTTGEFDAPVDPTAPQMDNPVRRTDKLYVCGDVRANENPLLLSFHTLFVREHNRLCDELARAHPDWNDEQLYQHARKIVGGLVQSILYNEWLPTMGVQLPPYAGYRPDLNPQLMNVFTAAAFRLGHTLLNGNLQRLDENGVPLPQGPLSLRDAFFNPQAVVEAGGIEPFLQGMGAQIQQSMDAKVVDDVRNFLFGPPGAGGLDLASININRGRERGLPDFNTIRRNFGLQQYYFFNQINHNAETASRLNGLYKNINNIDPWVGLMAEAPMRRALFGETLMTILGRQFTALRDGDRFFYEIDPVLTPQEKEAIRSTTLHDIVMRNTGIHLMQDRVFEAMPHTNICQHMTVEVNGRIRMETGITVPDVDVALRLDGEQLDELSTGSDGHFLFPAGTACPRRELALHKTGRALNGVTTMDLLLVQKHVLGMETLDSPYKLIAADVNNSGAVSTVDLIQMRKLILGVQKTWDNNKVWRFVPADFVFEHPDDPWEDRFPRPEDFIAIDGAHELEYIAVKTGDVNNSVDIAEDLAQAGIDLRGEGPALELRLNDRSVRAGETVSVPVTAAGLPSLIGYQFSLSYDPSGLTLEGVRPGILPALSADNFGLFAGEGLITTSWNLTEATLLQPGDVLFELTFRAARSGDLSRMLALSDAQAAAAYDEALEERPVRLYFDASAAAPAGAFALYQNQPNPFRQTTAIPFYLPEPGQASLTVFDATGRVVLSLRGRFAAGPQQWNLDRTVLPAAGVFYYQVAAAAGTETKKMLLVD